MAIMRFEGINPAISVSAIAAGGMAASPLFAIKSGAIDPQLLSGAQQCLENEAACGREPSPVAQPLLLPMPSDAPGLERFFAPAAPTSPSSLSAAGERARKGPVAGGRRIKDQGFSAVGVPEIFRRLMDPNDMVNAPSTRESRKAYGEKTRMIYFLQSRASESVPLAIQVLDDVVDRRSVDDDQNAVRNCLALFQELGEAGTPALPVLASLLSMLMDLEVWRVRKGDISIIKENVLALEGLGEISGAAIMGVLRLLDVLLSEGLNTDFVEEALENICRKSRLGLMTMSMLNFSGRPGMQSRVLRITAKVSTEKLLKHIL